MWLIETAIVVLIIAKLLGLIWWSWWIVLAPFWIGAMIFILGLFFKRR